MKLKLLKTLITFYVNVKNVVSLDNENNEDSKIINKIINNNIDKFLKKEQLYEYFLEMLEIYNPDKYYSYIDKVNENKTDGFLYLLNKLNNELRYNLLNENIETELQNLKKYNIYAYQNLKHIITASLIKAKDYLHKSEPEYSFFPIEKSLDIINNYLDTIDKSRNLSRLFKEKLQDNTIILWNSNAEDKELEIIQKYKNLIFDTKDWTTFNEDERLYINAPYENNILDICKLVHEFFHYYILKSKHDMLEINYTQSFFEEFIPIFYETDICIYLESIGIDKDIAKSGILEREKYFIINLNSLLDISRLLILKSKNKDINVNDIKKMYKLEPFIEKIKTLEGSKKQEYYDSLEDYGIVLDNIDETANNICDNINFNIIETDYTEYKTINYIVAKLLTDNIISQINNGQTYLKKRVFEVTNILIAKETNILEILELLECENVFNIDNSLLVNNIKAKKLGTIPTKKTN